MTCHKFKFHCIKSNKIDFKSAATEKWIIDLKKKKNSRISTNLKKLHIKIMIKKGFSGIPIKSNCRILVTLDSLYFFIHKRTIRHSYAFKLTTWESQSCSNILEHASFWHL